MHTYEVRAAKIIAALIQFPMCCRSVGCGFPDNCTTIKNRTAG
jgi:hypothetical protein